MTRVRAAGILALIAWLPAGCSFSPDIRGPEGCARSREDRERYVAERAVAPAPSLKDGPATLEDLLRLVEEGSVPVQQARAQVEGAAASVRRARADLLPNVAIDVDGLGWSRAPGSSGFTTDRHVLAGVIEVAMPLDVSGRLAESVRAVQARYRSAAWRLEVELRAQRLLVAQGYFNLLEALDLADVNEAAVAVQEKALRDGQARYEVGVLRKNDVLVIEVALSNSRQRSVAIQSAILQARRALNAAAGLPIGRMTEVAPFAPLIPPEPSVIPLLDRARSQNPEVDVLIEMRTALLHDIRAKEREDLPEVSVGPRIIATTDHTSDPRQNSAGFLSLRWNPDLSGRVAAERSELKARLLDLAWQVTGLLRRIEVSILMTHQDTVEKTSALQAALTSLDQARENLRIVLEQFRAGISTGREVLEAQALLTQQEGTLKTARHAVNRSQFELFELSGVDPLVYAGEVAAWAAETRAASRPESR